MQVKGFRMALWSEHAGILSPNFDFPADLDCVREMRQIATINWNVRTACCQYPRSQLESKSSSRVSLGSYSRCMLCHGRHNVRDLHLHMIWQDAQGVSLPPHRTGVCSMPVLYCVVCHTLDAPLQVYSGPEVADMAGHLMVYPYHVSETGAITYLGSEFLPDTKTAKVIQMHRLTHLHS